MAGVTALWTFTVNPDATEFTIGIASFTVLTADGMRRGVGGGDALTVVQFCALSRGERNCGYGWPRRDGYGDGDRDGYAGQSG